MIKRTCAGAVALILVAAGLVVGTTQAQAYDPIPYAGTLAPFSVPLHPTVVVPGAAIGDGAPGGGPGAGFTGTISIGGTTSSAGATMNAYQFGADGSVTFARSAVVDASGDYTLDGLPDGSYWLESYLKVDAQHVYVGWNGVDQGWPEGYAYPVTAGAAATVDGYPRLTGSISGTVSCDDGCDTQIDFTKTVIDLYAKNTDTAEQRTTLDVNGRFTFSVAHPADYVAVVRYSGSNYVSSQVSNWFTVADGQSTTVSLGLKQLRPDLHTGDNLGPALEANVYGMYWDFLHRTPGVSDVRSWMAGFDVVNSTYESRETPQAWMARNFVDSDEYRLKRIDDAYQSILGRAPDAGGRAMWLDDMKRGYISTDDILKSLYESAEYFQNHGGTNGTFAKALYNALLNRDGSSSDYAWWGGLAGQHGRNWVVDQFWMSDETTSDRVSAMYASYLGRTPDAGGLAGWKSIDLRLGDSIARQGIVSSQEYWWRCMDRFPVAGWYHGS